MRQKLKIYGNAWNVRSAGQWYRVRVPLLAMKRLGIADCFVDDPFQDGDARSSYLWGGDVQLMLLVAGRAIFQQTQAIRELEPKRNEAGMVQYPPIIVYDMDDDIESINPLNPKFATLGTRDEDGNLLDPYSEFAIRMDEGGLQGDPIPLWQHGLETQHGTFDAARNVAQHAQVRKMAATAHALTVTGKALADVAKSWSKRVHIFPNSLLFDEFQQFDIRRPADDVRVMWQGGYSHYPDFYPLRNAFGQAAQEMPQIKWVVFGQMFGWTYEKISQFRIEFHPWVAHELFHMKLGTLVPDINIAPLADTRFNRCKSGIKFYEAAALSVPTLAQRSGPYAEEIIDGVTGLLFSTPQEFVEKLRHLVRDKEYRQKIGARAHEWVREHRDAMKTVVPLLDFYTTLIRETRGASAA